MDLSNQVPERTRNIDVILEDFDLQRKTAIPNLTPRCNDRGDIILQDWVQKLKQVY
jgi:hypothetical protein